jgi:hypothetical protein
MKLSAKVYNWLTPAKISIILLVTVVVTLGTVLYTSADKLTAFTNEYLTVKVSTEAAKELPEHWSELCVKGTLYYRIAANNGLHSATPVIIINETGAGHYVSCYVTKQGI